MVHLHIHGFVKVFVFLKMVAHDVSTTREAPTLQETLSKGSFRAPLFCESLFGNHSRTTGEQNELFVLTGY